MPKIYRFLLLLPAILPFFAEGQVNVTFRVNMSDQVVSVDGVHLAGSFNGFSITANPMTDEGNGIFETTMELPSDSLITYKFVNGNVFELVTTACGIDDGNGNINRNFIVPSDTLTLPLVCFGSCENCPADPVNITFRVNMGSETVSGDGVKLAGSFNGFSTTANPMTNVGGGFYQTTVALNPGAFVTYKFVNGTAFEVISTTCGIDDGSGNVTRSYSVPSVNATIPGPCFSTCNNCEIIIPNVNLTFRVNMTNETVSGDGIFLAGSFNGFSITANPMTLVGGGIYETTLLLPQGSIIAYKFVNGDIYELISTDCGVDDGSGNINRSISVPTVNSAITTVCFNSCADCTEEHDITFQVNMSNQVIDPSGVFLTGSFNGYSTTANPLTAAGNGIYSTTLQLSENAVIAYKFLNGPVYEIISTECGVDDGSGIINRNFTVPAGDSTVALVCFGSCTDCEIPDSVSITFQVNMSNETVAPEGVFLAGSFNGFSTTANPMTDAGNGIYQATIELPADLLVTWKFVNGTTYEVITNQCGIDDGNGNINRDYTVTSSSDTLPAVCFNSCSDCDTGTVVNVTFQVNMSNEAVAAQGVFLAGSFNGFSTTANPMTDAGNGIYQATLELTAGLSVAYKFINGTVYEIVSGDCAVDDGNGNLNRTYSVTSASTTLPAACFNLCVDCAPVSTLNAEILVDMSTQAIDPAGVFIAGSFNGFSTTANPMNSIGSGIYSVMLQLQPLSTVTYKFLNGPVWEEITGICTADDGNGNINRSLSIPSNSFTTPVSCFGSCGVCLTTSNPDIKINAIAVYPNPAASDISISNAANTTFKIYSVDGKLVLTAFSVNSTALLDISALTAGVYIISGEKGGRKEFIKVIKQ